MSRFVMPFQSAFAQNLSPYDGAKLYFYETGTSNAKDTYSDSALTSANDNPVEANANGRFSDIWLKAGNYKVVLKDKNDVQLWEADPVGGDVGSTITNTITTLKALNVSDYTDVFVLGHTSVNDGGGGRYHFVSGDSTADNNGTVIQPTVGSGRWIFSPSQQVTVRTFGAVGDGTTDDTTAFNNTVSWAVTNSHKTVFIPRGDYVITGQIQITEGIALIGEGCQGSTEQYGTTILHKATTNLFLWDGSGTDSAGPGGGARDLLIIKDTGYQGGDAIKLLATSTAKRPGEMWFTNILIYGTGTGQWDRGLHVNGSAANDAGNRGVRSLHFHKFRVGTCRENNAYVVFNQATHVTGDIQIDNASGSGTTGMTLQNYWDNITLNCRIGGTVVVGHSGAGGGSDPANLTLYGSIATLDVNYDTVVGGFWGAITSDCMNASLRFKISSYYTSAFAAYLNGSTSNDKTGDGTNYTVLYDTELNDDGSDFNTGTGVFTCKNSGMYHFTAMVTLQNLGSGHTRVDAYLNHKTAAAATLRTYPVVLNPYAMSASGYCTLILDNMFQVDEGQTVEVTVSVSGSTKTVGVIGNSTTTIYSVFSGKLLA